MLNRLLEAGKNLLSVYFEKKSFEYIVKWFRDNIESFEEFKKPLSDLDRVLTKYSWVIPLTINDVDILYKGGTNTPFIEIRKNNSLVLSCFDRFNKDNSITHFKYCNVIYNKEIIDIKKILSKTNVEQIKFKNRVPTNGVINFSHNVYDPVEEKENKILTVMLAHIIKNEKNFAKNAKNEIVMPIEFNDGNKLTMRWSIKKFKDSNNIREILFTIERKHNISLHYIFTKRDKKYDVNKSINLLSIEKKEQLFSYFNNNMEEIIDIHKQITDYISIEDVENFYNLHKVFAKNIDKLLDNKTLPSLVAILKLQNLSVIKKENLSLSQLDCIYLYNQSLYQEFYKKYKVPCNFVHILHNYFIDDNEELFSKTIREIEWVLPLEKKIYTFLTFYEEILKDKVSLQYFREKKDNQEKIEKLNIKINKYINKIFNVGMINHEADFNIFKKYFDVVNPVSSIITQNENENENFSTILKKNFAIFYKNKIVASNLMQNRYVVNAFKRNTEYFENYIVKRIEYLLHENQINSGILGELSRYQVGNTDNEPDEDNYCQEMYEAVSNIISNFDMVNNINDINIEKKNNNKKVKI